MADLRDLLQSGEAYDTGIKRTGCMFCMFGVHDEQKGKNRFQLMSISHPKHWDYCINKLGCGKVLEHIGVEYEPTIDTYSDIGNIESFLQECEA